MLLDALCATEALRHPAWLQLCHDPLQSCLKAISRFRFDVSCLALDAILVIACSRIESMVLRLSMGLNVLTALPRTSDASALSWVEFQRAHVHMRGSSCLEAKHGLEGLAHGGRPWQAWPSICATCICVTHVPPPAKPSLRCWWFQANVCVCVWKVRSHKSAAAHSPQLGLTSIQMCCMTGCSHVQINAQF